MMIKLEQNKFEGYVSEVEDGVWISAIKSKNIGQGDFSKLIKILKGKYKWIKIPTPSNMMVERVEHLGFKRRSEFFEEPFNEMGIVMYWSSQTLNKESLE